MKYNGFRNTRSNKNAIIFGIIFTSAIFFILAFLASLILSSMKNPLGSSGLFSFAVLLFTGAISGFFTSKYKGEHGVFPSCVCAVIFALILFGIGLIVSGGKIAMITVVNLLSYIALALIFAAMAKNKRKRRRTR